MYEVLQLPANPIVPDTTSFSYTWNRFISGKPDLMKSLDYDWMSEAERQVIYALLLAARDKGTWCGIPDVAVHDTLERLDDEGMNYRPSGALISACDTLRRQSYLGSQNLKMIIHEKTTEHDQLKGNFVVYYPTGPLVSLLSNTLFTQEPDPPPSPYP